MKPLLEVLMERDDLSREEAQERIAEAQARVIEGEDPEEILLEEFGLEADWVLDLLPHVG